MQVSLRNSKYCLVIQVKWTWNRWGGWNNDNKKNRQGSKEKREDVFVYWIWYRVFNTAITIVKWMHSLEHGIPMQATKPFLLLLCWKMKAKKNESKARHLDSSIYIYQNVKGTLPKLLAASAFSVWHSFIHAFIIIFLNFYFVGPFCVFAMQVYKMCALGVRLGKLCSFLSLISLILQHLLHSLCCSTFPFRLLFTRHILLTR